MRASKLILSILVFALAVAPAFAKGKPASAGSDKKSDKAPTTHGKKDSDHGKSAEHKAAHGKKDADHGKNHAKNEHGRDGDPAGYDKGKKTGWGDCDAPPGQAKKEGVNCKDKKKSGGIFFKRKDKKDDKKVEAKATSPKPVPTTTTRTTRTTRTTTTSTTAAPKPAAAPKPTASGTTAPRPASTTATRTTRTARATTGGQDRLEEVKKR